MEDGARDVEMAEVRPRNYDSEADELLVVQSFASPTSVAQTVHDWRARYWSRRAHIGALVLGNILLGVLAAVSSSMSAYVMPAYPAWLLYAPQAGLVVLFWLAARRSGEALWLPGVGLLRQLELSVGAPLAVLLAAHQVMLQFSSPWLDPDLAQVLANVGLPLVAALSRWWLGHRYTRRYWVGLAVVLLGAALGVVPGLQHYVRHGGDAASIAHLQPSGEQDDQPAWVVLFALGACLQDVMQVYQEREMARNPVHVTPLRLLFWVSVYSWPLLVLLAVPLEAVRALHARRFPSTLGEAVANQFGALACAFGAPVARDRAAGQAVAACQAWAWFWPPASVLTIGALLVAQTVLIRETDAVLAVSVSAAVPPLVALVFTMPAIVGEEHTAPFRFLTLLAFLLIGGGLWLMRSDYRRQLRREPQEGTAQAERTLEALVMGSNYVAQVERTLEQRQQERVTRRAARFAPGEQTALDSWLRAHGESSSSEDEEYMARALQRF